MLKNMKSDDEITYSDSTSATVHLYCAVEKRQMSANWRTETLIFFTVLFELLATCTLTEIVSPWWYSCATENRKQKEKNGIENHRCNDAVAAAPTSLSKLASKWILFGFNINSLLTSIDGCSPNLEGAYIIFLIANRTEFRLCGLSSMCSPTNALSS